LLYAKHPVIQLIRMNNCEISKILEKQLDLRLFPVAIKLIYRWEEVPKKEQSKRTFRSYCHGVMLASEGSRILILRENIACQYGAATLGLRDYDDKMLSGKSQYAEGAFGNLEAAKNAVVGGHEIKTGTKAIFLSPLAEADEDYQIVLIPITPEQGMLLLMAYNYKTGNVTKSLMKASGLQAFCRDCTAYPLLTGNINFSLVAVGDRMRSGLPPQYMLVGIPKEKVSEIAENLEIMGQKLIPRYRSSTRC